MGSCQVEAHGPRAKTSLLKCIPEVTVPHEAIGQETAYEGAYQGLERNKPGS